jgi:hypothetical protein
VCVGFGSSVLERSSGGEDFSHRPMTPWLRLCLAILVRTAALEA